ncbi:MAG: uroporphyrinogen decarboxylase family protein [Phycisphaerae bacterium]
MTSRERVHRAINFQKPDRIPIDLGSMRATGINAVLYDRLKRRLGLAADSPTKVHGTMDVLAEIEPEVAERFHVDVLPLEANLCAWNDSPATAGVQQTLYGGTKVFFPPRTNITKEPSGDWLMRDTAGRPFACMPANGFYFDFIGGTFSNGSGGGIDPAKFKPSGDVSDEVLTAFARRARRLNSETDKALFGWGSGISFMGLSFLLTDNITQGALDEWLVMLMADKPAANDMMARSTDAAIERTKLFHQAVGDTIEVWGVASDDAGTQRGPLIAPELFREMITPHYKRLCDWIHKNTRWKTFLHSCGSIYEYIGPWIEAGIDILNPVQISAANMQPEKLMKEFGDRIVFWGGGCETQKMLPLGTPAEIREHVRRNIEVFSKNGSAQGGFVFAQVHNIQPNVPVENVVAMLDAAYEFGGGGPPARH